MKLKSVKNVADMADERLVPEMVPWYQQQMIRDHVSRYEFASKFVDKKIVADMACGSGYGSKLLSKNAIKVYGVDISHEAISYAKQKHASRKTIYLCEDVMKTSLANKSIDIVVSFETLEHLVKQEDFIFEVKRVLRPGGMFIVSTPNVLVNGGEANPFHQKELSFDEFSHLLKKNFSSITFYGQKPMHKGYLKLVVAITKKLPKGWLKWVVDSGMKMVFRGSNIKLIKHFGFNFVPAFFVAVCRK